MMVLIHNDDEKLLRVSYVDHSFLKNALIKHVYGDFIPEKTDEYNFEDMSVRLIKGEKVDLGEGFWVASQNDTKGLCDFFVREYKELRDELCYEDQERVKNAKEAATWKLKYEQLRDSLNSALTDEARRRLEEHS